MPDINGINTAYIIKSSNDIKNTPHIVIVSAFESEDVRRKTEEANIRWLLNKTC